MHCIALLCTVLHYYALYCITMHSIALLCTALHYYAQYCITMHCIALICTVLQHDAQYCITMHCIALLCTVLHYYAPYCITMHSIASLCTVLHHYAQYCITMHCCQTTQSECDLPNPPLLSSSIACCLATSYCYHFLQWSATRLQQTNDVSVIIVAAEKLNQLPLCHLHSGTSSAPPPKASLICMSSF